jgi:hypothetical protein
MRIYDSEIYAFILGAGLSWAVTYFSLTREKRLIDNIKRNVDQLGGYHGLSPGRYMKTIYPTGLASDEEILAAHSWALQTLQVRTSPPIKLSPTVLAAEVIICEKLLGLTAVHAIRVLMRTKDCRDLEKNLRDVTAELADDDRFSN